MNKETRIKKIEKITKGEPFGRQEIPWMGELTQMNSYQIPLEYLIYNKYNGRILSRTKSLERQNYIIDEESTEGKNVIEKLLWETDIPRNKRTLKNIEQYGQQKVGIITKDGVVIDGNRRVLLLNQIDKYDYFKAIVLPVTLQENPLEIEKLETTYQMGEDEKLSYNPIEKYLKTKGLLDRHVTKEQIAEWMGESVETINKYEKVMKMMDEYLKRIDYEGIYTQLDGREDQLITLTSWSEKFYQKESKDGFDGYRDYDVDDLVTISFDYIRAKFEGKQFRIIANGRGENHFFGRKSLWEVFRDYHFKNIPPIQAEETPIDYETENLKAHLDARDRAYTEKAMPFLEENIKSREQQLEYNRAANEPEKLLESSFSALDSINTKHKAFPKSENIEKIKDIHQKTSEMLGQYSPRDLLLRISDLLDIVNVNEEIDKEELLVVIKEINKKSFEIKKELGG